MRFTLLYIAIIVSLIIFFITFPYLRINIYNDISFEEGFANNIKNKNININDNISDALLNLNNSDTVTLQQGYSSDPKLDSEINTNINDRMSYPDSDDIVRYNGNGCYKDIDTRGIKKLSLTDNIKVRCRPYTDNVKEDHANNIYTGFMSPMTNDVTDRKYSKIQFYVPKLYMGKDPYISGVSFALLGSDIEIPADIDQIGSIPVDDFSGEPIPVNSSIY